MPDEKFEKDKFNLPVQNIKGVGPARAQLFAKLDIFNVQDLMLHFAREYEDRSIVKKIGMLKDGESCSFIAKVDSTVTEKKMRKGFAIYKFQVSDDSGSTIISLFNQPYSKNYFKLGQQYVFFGKVFRRYKIFEIQNPVYEIYKEEQGGTNGNSLRIVPVYPSTAGLAQNIIRNAVREGLEILKDSFTEFLPESVRNDYKLCEINYAMKNIHFPNSAGEFEYARRRLVFEELLLFQLGLFRLKCNYSQDREGIHFDKTGHMQEFIDKLPFRLTNAQQRVLSEVMSDMGSKKMMNRLVQGDVGSGKTIIAVLALYNAFKNGYQGAMMVPTEILAEQHYKSLLCYFENTGIIVVLLTGSLSKKEKGLISAKLAEGDADIVIGTHALLEEKLVFKKPGLIITDEQHRFGVRQRTVLINKGVSPDVLVMTATPIPRTLALILFGDLDISVIDEMPPGRKPVKTYSVDESMRERIDRFIRKQVEEGRQVYIVCPLVEDSINVEAASAVEVAVRIAEKDFKDLRVGLLHGKMKQKEKDEIMRKFVDAEISILVSTTVIEVGVNVPNAALMVIENAERFGLAQLHQLRGRVGRGEHQSYCVLYNINKTELSIQRMKVMEETNNGFKISEKDLELRGPGDFFGTRQHGIPDLKIANLYRDMDILKEAQAAAIKLYREDSMLEKAENRLLGIKLKERFTNRIDRFSCL